MNTVWGKVMLGVIVAGMHEAAGINIPGTRVDYFAAQDSVTTDNRGVVRIFEINDTTGLTYVRFACEARVLQAYFHGKNPLVSPAARAMELYPLVVYQVDDQQLKTFKVSGMLSKTGQGLLESVAFENDQLVVDAFRHAVRRVTLRIPRLGMSELTYVFAVKGFRQALSRIKPC
ncbi:hypothetical protein DEDE109153_08560 [Deinococcus deserti]|uniref:Uncharacterized protein n=1 Tax=Deinococcus deserti (strain DSM 17065 / CIP 109153 / LMG 22923 / VCD115) TaxID=546414 RepID=C1D3W3_DEIDV|nr:hypothetical protein [Deinococcus deserti]ACO48192.2 hypothetical protein Deide_3p02330 [Deinococcus deserti VCD115]